MSDTPISSNSHTIARQLVAEDQRTNVTADLFGVYFPLQLEPFVFSMASRLSEDYGGGYWLFYTLDNGGLYMAPDSDRRFQVVSPNGWEGFMSADAFGIAVCLFAYSNLSFGSGQFAETCAEQYHLLREYMMDHAEAGAILRATD
ncbi:MAG: antirestriction protein [Betaproteobacteria bacterium]|nr:antirestriction protein [Betaproteobacteria bacterium]